jgi:hypothetical protein
MGFFFGIYGGFCFPIHWILYNIQNFDSIYVFLTTVLIHKTLYSILWIFN